MSFALKLKHGCLFNYYIVETTLWWWRRWWWWFAGNLFPLNERATRTIRNLHVENERVIQNIQLYSSNNNESTEWYHAFFSFLLFFSLAAAFANVCAYVHVSSTLVCYGKFMTKLSDRIKQMVCIFLPLYLIANEDIFSSFLMHIGSNVPEKYNLLFCSWGMPYWRYCLLGSLSTAFIFLNQVRSQLIV